MVVVAVSQDIYHAGPCSVENCERGQAGECVTSEARQSKERGRWHQACAPADGWPLTSPEVIWEEGLEWMHGIPMSAGWGSMQESGCLHGLYQQI